MTEIENTGTKEEIRKLPISNESEQSEHREKSIPDQTAGSSSTSATSVVPEHLITATVLLPIEDLTPLFLREIRPHNVKKLTQSIRAGYNPARALSVIQKEGGFIVVDGCHRLQAAVDVGLEELPCRIYPEGTDPIRLSMQCNEQENIYASLDFFDRVQIIKQLRAEGETQEQIGERLGWTRNQVARYCGVLDKIAPEVLQLAQVHQQGRHESFVPNGTEFSFTEGFFRDNGFFEIVDCQGNPHAIRQLRVMEWFINEKKCKAASWEIQEEVAWWLPSPERVEEPGSPFSSTATRIDKKDRNKVFFGVNPNDELAKLPNHLVDLVITDPPREERIHPPTKSNQEQADDTGIPLMEYLAWTFREVQRVLKPTGHCYVFFPMLRYKEYYHLLKQYLFVNPVPLVWINHRNSPRSLDRTYSHRYETLFFCLHREGKSRPLKNPHSSDVLEYDTKTHGKRKPLELLKYLIANSTSAGQVVLDPFMGSGATLQAAALLRRDYLGFEREERYRSSFIRRMGKLRR